MCFHPEMYLGCLLKITNDCFWKTLHPEAVAWRCFTKKVFLEILQNSQENTCARDSLLIKLQAETFNFPNKKTLAQVFPCGFCKISNNIFSYKAPPVAASVHHRSLTGFCICLWKLLFGSKYSEMDQERFVEDIV